MNLHNWSTFAKIDLGVIQDDGEYLRANASKVQDALLIPRDRCGRAKGSAKREALCAQRAVLAALGWITWADYEKVDAKAKTVPAIERLQKALGVEVDGDWGPDTNKALDRILKAELGAGASAYASEKPAGAGGGRPATAGGKSIPGLPGASEEPSTASSNTLLYAGLGLAVAGGLAALYARMKKRRALAALEGG